MSAFVLVMAAVVVGNGLEGVPGETYRGLDLRGAWAGTYECRGLVVQVILAKGILYIAGIDSWDEMPLMVINEGAGKVRVRPGPPGNRTLPGIFKLEGDAATICFSKERRPASFKAEGGQVLLTLHRVKPGK